jgi:hypothetical protein
LIDYGREAAVREQLERTVRSGANFTIAPPALIELTRGLIKSGAAHFDSDKMVFAWLHEQNFGILPLPYPFMTKVLGSSITPRGRVEPQHYRELISMVSGAADFADFIKKTADTVWQDVSRADQIHSDELDKEIAALGSLAKLGRDHNYARRLSQKLEIPGCRPNPLILARRFSAALEFLESSIVKIRSGSNPRKNDPGLYTDFQLLLYLGDDELRFLTNEKFAAEIKRSPQCQHILGLDLLR